jgi:hypothetical protein
MSTNWESIRSGMRDWLLRKLDTRAREGGSFTMDSTIERGEDVRVTRKAPVEGDLTNDDGTVFKPHDPWRPETHL